MRFETGGTHKCSVRAHKKYGGRVPISRDPNDLYEAETAGFISSNRRRRYGWNGKNGALWSTRHVNNWLRKQVGRLWDDVWADVCAEFDNRSAKGNWFRKHIRRSFIVDHCAFVDPNGDIRTYDLYKCEINVPHNHYGTIITYTQHHPLVEGLYVHPVTGILHYQQPETDYDVRWGCIRVREPKLRTIQLSTDEWYQEVEVGRKHKFVAWFHYQTKTTKYVYWCPVDAETEVLRRRIYGGSYYADKTDEWILTREYELRNDNGVPVWGRWSRGEHHTENRRSCNRKQLAWIRKHLAD